MTPSLPLRHRILEIVGAGAILTVLTVAFLRPTPERMAHAFLPDRGDPVFNLYVLSWGIHQFELGLPGYWDANVFSPTPKALTLSDHLIGPAAFGWALSPLVPNPIVVYNLLVLGSFIVTGAATFWVLRRSGASFPGALLASCGYAFSAFRWTHLNHVQILLMGCIPLVLWAFDRLLTERSLRWALAFLAVYLLHLSGGAYLAYMIHFPLAALFANRAASEGRKLAAPRTLALLGGVAAIALAAGLALFHPYRSAQKDFQVERTARELETLGATPLSYVTPSTRNLYGKPVQKALTALTGRPPREATLFPGFFTLIAASLGVLAWLRGTRRKDAEMSLGESARDPWVRGVALSGAVTVLLSFPIVFGPLAQVLPGMDGMRAPARFFAFTGFALALFAARGFDWLWGRTPTRRGRTALLAGASALVLVNAVPTDFKWVRIPTREEQPPVYQWLAGKLPGGPEGAGEVRALLELPMKAGAGETLAMWAATVHWKPIANGYSGFLPAPYREIAATCRPLPSRAALDRLRELGITHLVIHTRDEKAQQLRRLLPAWTEEHEGRDVERVYDDGRDRVVKILPLRLREAGLSGPEP